MSKKFFKKSAPIPILLTDTVTDTEFGSHTSDQSHFYQLEIQMTVVVY